MAADYWKLNKVVPPLQAVVLSVAGLMERLSQELGTYRFVADLANTFSSIDRASESRDPFASPYPPQDGTRSVTPTGVSYVFVE